MGCFVRGGKHGMGCFVRGDKNCMVCFVRGGKLMRDVLSGVSKNGMGCFVPGCFVLHSVPTFSKGSNCLYPIETHITCDFPGRSGPLTPLWIRTCYLDQQEIFFSVQWSLGGIFHFYLNFDRP